jgi:sensor domain CHASE-containing protein
MIKFFRQIRQNMVKENRTSKYLLYAIDEIILVVIGILIAISNWNENRKTKLQDSLVSLITKKGILH